MWLAILLTVLAGYLLGNLNGAVSISNLIEKKDVREQGSGNAGLTNFLRVFGPGSAILVVLVDMIKAVIACLLGKLLLTPYGYALEGLMLGGLSVCLGHDFPALLGFRGGKGVLSGVTVALVADWRCALLVIGVFAACLLLSRYVSLGSILGSLTFAVVFPVLHWQNTLAAVMGILLALLIVFMHRSNIARLLKGTENKVTLGKKTSKNKQ